MGRANGRSARRIGRVMPCQELTGWDPRSMSISDSNRRRQFPITQAPHFGKRKNQITDRLRAAARAAMVEPLEERTLFAANGLFGTYFDNIDYTGPSVSRVDAKIDPNVDD